MTQGMRTTMNKNNFERSYNQMRKPYASMLWQQVGHNHHSQFDAIWLYQTYQGQPIFYQRKNWQQSISPTYAHQLWT